MTRNSGGPGVNPKEGASKPARDESGRESDGIAGDVAEKGRKPSPNIRGETSSDEDCAIDLDTAHDRAS